MDPIIAARAAEDGLFTFHDLRCIGLTRHDLEAWLRNKECRVVVRGVFSVRPKPDSDELRAADRARAMLVSNPHVAATGTSALVLHGLPVYAADLSRARGVWTNEAPTRSSADVVIRRPRTRPDIVDLDGYPVVTPAWAVADVAARDGVQAGLVAGDAAVHRGLLAVEEFRAVVARLTGTHGHGRARATMDLIDGRTESVAETRARLIFVRHNIAVEPQFEVRDQQGAVLARADFRVVGLNLLIEVDGMLKYREDAVAAIRAEKAREAALREHGWDVVRLTWADLNDERLVLRRLDSAVRRAA